METKKSVILVRDNEKIIYCSVDLKKCSSREASNNAGLRFLMTTVVTPLSEYQECSQRS